MDNLTVRVGIWLDYSGGFRAAVDHVVELEKTGVDVALVAEAYSFNAVSQLGYLTARTSTIELGSGVFPIYTLKDRREYVTCRRLADPTAVTDGSTHLNR